MALMITASDLLCVNLSSSCLPAPPALKLSVNETYVVDPGQDVTMSCEVTAGFPTPTVTWARYPSPLPRRAIIRGGSLTLRSVTPADSGLYNCTAVNNVGNPARRNVNLVVRSMCVLHYLYLYSLSFVYFPTALSDSRISGMYYLDQGYSDKISGLKFPTYCTV